MSAAETKVPSAANQAIDRGSDVSRIQNPVRVSAGNIKSIPTCRFRLATPLSPWLRCSELTATKAHPVLVLPLADLIRMARSS